ncbi:MAG TPA: C25 family cysteine peptidase [Bacteroidales bacterium]|nr:C25 family cysteine peptidase [Bacteroidales bacterium]
MKLHGLIAAVLLLTANAFAQQGFYAGFSQPHENVYEISFDLADWSLNQVTHDGVIYQTIAMGTSAVCDKKGWAELPVISAAIQLPPEKDVDIAVAEASYYDIQLQHPMLPSRGIIARSEDPSTIPYWTDPASLVDEFYPQQHIGMDEPFIFRDVRGTAVRVIPFRYNAATGVLRVYTRIVVQLTENNHTPTNPLIVDNTNRILEVEGIYRSMFLNYSPSATKTDLAMDEYGDLLVLVPTSYASTITPYVTWKREMGYNVTVTTVSTGTNVTSTIQTAYNNNPNLLYVQLVGDWADIKSNTLTSSVVSSSYNVGAPMDPQMGCVSGTDNFADIAIGRFSCANAADLTVQINKAIKYEKEPDNVAGWRETFIGVGSEEGTGDDSEYDYQHIQRIYTQRLDGFTYDTHRQNYQSGANATTLAGHINTGGSTIAYCGHGDYTQWVTASFYNTNVNNLSNGDKLPFVVSVACLVGAFHNSSVVFAEAWLRKSGGGAVVGWFATISQPWNPPMRGQDYFYDILIGGFNYSSYSGQSGLTTSEQRTHFGSIVVNAMNLMLTESNTSQDTETTKTWATFGDASLQLRTKQPVALVLSNTSPAVGTPFAGTAYIGSTPAANVLICISQNGSYYHGLTNSSGAYSITHSLTQGDALLVATAFNTTTIYQTVTCVGGTPCWAVNTLSGTSDGSTVNLTWSAPSEGSVSGYNIYRDGVLQSTTTSTTYTQSSVPNGTYEYCVAALFNNEECYLRECVTVVVNDGSNNDCDSPSDLGIAEVNSTTHTLTWIEPEGAGNIAEDVESHTSWTLNSPGSVGWSYIDGDALATFGASAFNFTNESSAMAYIVFDHAGTTGGTPNGSAHSGNKVFADISPSNSSAANDWIISPELNFDEAFTFSFYAKSYVSTYGLERFKVAYSTTGTQQANFTFVTTNYIEAPVTWTLYTYTIPATAKYVAIQCVSADAFIFMLDDLYIGDGGGVAEAPIGYNVYCDNVFLGNAAGTNFTNSSATTGYHQYCVEAVYADGCISPEICATIGSTATYTIAATAGANGTISPAGTTTVSQGGSQTYTITPNACYHIADVLVDGVSVGAVTSYTFTNINANHTIAATFSATTYAITASAGSGGSISPSGGTAVPCNGSQTYTISPNACYQIANVLVDGTSVGAVTTYTFNNVNANHTISVSFSVITYSINASAGTGGSITPSGNTSVTCNGSQTFTITPSSCYQIDDVLVDGTSIGAVTNYTFNNINANHTISVSFELLTYTITASAGAGGSISPSGSVDVNCGSGQTFEIAPENGYEVASVLVDGNDVGAVSSYTYSNLTSNSTIVANFSLITVEECSAPENLSATATADYIVLNWDAAPNAISYNVYRNGALLVNTTSVQFFDVTAEEEVEYSYYVVSVCSDSESDPSNPASATINVGIIESNDNTITAYPNPTSGIVEIVLKNDSDNYHGLVLTSLDGKMLLNSVIEGETIRIDLSDFADGMYIIRISGSSGNDKILHIVKQ